MRICARAVLLAVMAAAVSAPNAAFAEGVGFYVIKDSLVMTKADIRSAEASRGNSGRWGVTIRFRREAAKRLAALTRNNVGRQVQFVVGNRVISTPVLRGPILGGSLRLSGNFGEAEAKKIAEQIRSGR